MEKKVKKPVNKKFNKEKAAKPKELLDRNGEVIVPPFRVAIVEQLCSDPAKLASLMEVFQKYDLALASYV